MTTMQPSQPGAAGGQYEEPPVVNVADLLSRWTGELWRSTRHRVLPPPEQAPEEELISLIVFFDADVDTVIEPVTGNRELAPVVAGEWLLSRAASAAVPR